MIFAQKGIWTRIRQASYTHNGQSLPQPMTAKPDLNGDLGTNNSIISIPGGCDRALLYLIGGTLSGTDVVNAQIYGWAETFSAGDVLWLPIGMVQAAFTLTASPGSDWNGLGSQTDTVSVTYPTSDLESAKPVGKGSGAGTGYLDFALKGMSLLEIALDTAGNATALDGFILAYSYRNR